MDIALVKERQKATWMDGDFGKVAQYAQPLAEAFMSRVTVFKPGMKVLDVACGTGNLALIAARSGAEVSGSDIATNLIHQARTRADNARLSIKFEEGDAEALPYADASFDVVVSMFGVMFAPRPKIAAAELLRVCKPGGMIALANWVPDGFIGKMFVSVAKHVPPAPGVPHPLEWGVESNVRERFGSGIFSYRFNRANERITYPFNAAKTVEFFKTYFGPTKRAFEALPPEKRPALQAELEGLFASNNHGNPYSEMIVPAEFLEVFARRA